MLFYHKNIHRALILLLCGCSNILFAQTIPRNGLAIESYNKNSQNFRRHMKELGEKITPKERREDRKRYKKSRLHCGTHKKWLLPTYSRVVGGFSPRVDNQPWERGQEHIEGMPFAKYILIGSCSAPKRSKTYYCTHCEREYKQYMKKQRPQKTFAK